MYMPGQVVFDRDKQEPFQIDEIWDSASYPKRHTHFIQATEKHDKYVVVCPVSIKEAKELLHKGVITPAPVSVTHCWKCGNWWTNHNADGTCSG